MNNYGKGFEAYELISKKSVRKIITDSFSILGKETVEMMIIKKKSFPRWSDFYYSLDGVHQSMFDIYLDNLIK